MANLKTAVSSARGSWQGPGKDSEGKVKPLKHFGLFTSGGQAISSK